APLRRSPQRRPHALERLRDDRVNHALVAAGVLARLDVQRAAERVVGELRAQGGMARAQGLRVLRLDRQGEREERQSEKTRPHTDNRQQETGAITEQRLLLLTRYSPT